MNTWYRLHHLGLRSTCFVALYGIFSRMKTSLFDKTLKVDGMLSSCKKRRCLLIEKDIHQFRGQAIRISDWERVNPVEENNPSGKFLLLSDIFKCNSSAFNLFNVAVGLFDFVYLFVYILKYKS